MTKIIKKWHRSESAMPTTIAPANTPPPAPMTEEIREKARQEGFNQGLAEGKKQASQQVMAEQKAWRAQLEKLINSIPVQLQKNLQAQSPGIIDIVASILPGFFLHNAVSPENIEYAIQKALAEVEQDRKLCLLLSKEDYHLLQQEKIKLQVDAGVQVKASDKVVLGGCLIETGHGRFDARLEQQIDKLKEVLLNYKKQVAYE